MGKPHVPEASSVGEASPNEDLPIQGAGLLSRVLEETGLSLDAPPREKTAPRQVASLGGGVDAHTYLVRCSGTDVVVKFNDVGLEAEARALRAWKEHTQRVPEVLAVGVVPSAGARSMKYLVLGALLNDEGKVVETAAEYLDRSPEGARDVGRDLGAELHNLHRARCRAGFGNFEDSPGAERTYDGWGCYLEDFFMQHADYVRGVGIPDHQIEKTGTFIRECRYVEEARYLHGDVSVRNVAIRSYDPISISLFDPNPLCGDPSWDIAPMINNVEYGERRRRADNASPEALTRDRELLVGFWDSYPHIIADRSLLTAQLVQAILQAEHRQDASDLDETDDRDVEVTHEFIRDTMDRMSA